MRPAHALVLVALLAPSVLAQEQRGSIVGAVGDGTGAPVAGAKVEAESADGLLATTVSDDTGRYRFHALIPGRYAVRASAPGRVPSLAADVVLGLGRILELDLALPAAGRAETVAVVVDAPAIDFRQSARTVTYRREEISRLPRGRDFTSIVGQAPSANAEAKLGGLSIDGASASENRFVVDGMETTTILTGESGLPLAVDFVGEIQVKLSGAAAEYGGATGGVINVITRRGGPRWSGEAGASYSGTRLDARPRPMLRPSTTDSTRGEYFHPPADVVSRWEPGAAVGGPLGHEWRLFASYLPILTATERTTTFVDRSTRSYRRHAATHSATLNLGGQFGGRTRASVAVNASPAMQEALPEFTGAAGPADVTEVVARAPNYAFSANVDHARGPRLLLGARGGYWFTDFREEGVFQGPYYVFRASNVGMEGVPRGLQGPSGTHTAPNEESTRDRFRRASVQLDATWFASARGEHALKAGVQVDRTANDAEWGETGNFVQLFWGEAFDEVAGRFGYYQLRSNPVIPERGFITQGDVSSHRVALFVQDAWTIAGRVTVNVGLRAEHETVPSYAADPDIPPTAIRFGFGDKLAPRAGLAWDVGGTGRLKAYASWGVFHDTMKYALSRGLFGADKAVEYWFTLDDPDWTRIARRGCPPACPGTLIGTSAGSRRPLNDPQGNGVDPDLRPFRSREAILGVEHQVSGVLSLGLRLVRKRVDVALEDVGRLDAEGGNVVMVANPGFGRAADTGAGVPLPRARRDYDALELTAERRMSGGWAVRGGYVWSRLRGNYSGLSHSDQNGLRAPNLGGVFNHPFMSFDERGRPVLGVLATDRTHQAKVQAVRQFAFGTAIGLHAAWMTGVPVTREAAFRPGGAVFYRGRKSDGRTPPLFQVDVRVQQEIRVGADRRVRLGVDVTNVLDSDTATSRASRELAPGAAVSIDPEEFFAGFDTQALIAEQRRARNPLFLMDQSFQAPRAARVSLTFFF